MIFSGSHMSIGAVNQLFTTILSHLVCTQVKLVFWGSTSLLVYLMTKLDYIVDCC